MLKFVATFIFSLLLFGNISHAAPFSPLSTPRERVEIASANIMKLLASKEFKNSQTKAQAIEKLEVEVMNLFDFEAFSVRTIGPNWKKFSPAQKVAFKDAFTELLRNTYIDTLDSYDGQKLVYTGETFSKDKKKVEVKTLFKNGANAYPVNFRMLISSGEWFVYDVIIEGISMIKNYREQFRGILASSTPEELIKRIKVKATEKKEKMHSK